jgi:hypothetical protein
MLKALAVAEMDVNCFDLIANIARRILPSFELLWTRSSDIVVC